MGNRLPGIGKWRGDYFDLRTLKGSPERPPAGFVRAYAKPNGDFAVIEADGTETTLGAAGATTLAALTDVDTTGKADEDSLTWEATSSKWVPQAVTGGGSAAHVFPGVPTGSLVRSYTFDSTVESWTTTAGTLSSTGSKLRIAHTAAAVVLEPTAAADVGNGEYQFDYWGVAMPAGTASFGLIFRATDASNHYLWMLMAGTNQFELFKNVAGTYSSLANFPTSGLLLPKTGAGQRHRAMVRFDGSLLSLYIDGTLVGSVIDATYTTGDVGIRVDGQGGSSIIDIDNVKVYDTIALATPNV